MSDALPLPPRPNLDQYKRLAKDLQHACRSTDSNAVRDWAAAWVETLRRLQGTPLTSEAREEGEREAARINQRWQKLKDTRARGGKCLLADVQFFIARAHGFASWPKFAAHVDTIMRHNSPVSNFETAVDAIVAGDAAALKRLLDEHPELVRARSTREHRSTLLHYVSANGVEDFRQKTPKNIVEIARILLDAGADVDAESEAYGGNSTALGLAATSLHPEQAGVQIPLLETLLAYGATIEHQGLAGSGNGAIKGCLANGQGDAAEFFAARGASMDLEDAAGVGRLDVVRQYFREDGALRSDASQEQLESGFLYACGYGRTEVVRFLLDKGVNPGVRNGDGQTGLHWSTFGPHVDITEMLLQRGAPVNVKDDAFQATPIRWALHAWANSDDSADRERACAVIALLVRAGGQLDPDSLDARLEARMKADPVLQAALQGYDGHAHE
jgi:ankyrin repeat protein